MRLQAGHVPFAPVPDRRAAEPSLRALRLLVGWLALHGRPALEGLFPERVPLSGEPRTCELLFGVVAAACRCERIRARLELFVAARLGGTLLRVAEESVSDLALRFDRERCVIDDRELHAWLLALHTHPSVAARPLSERVADEIERRRRLD
ncbi:hypothetical protein MYXO_00823 [Myxococcaceae bacterium]|nr:hypothetical protein MYXO_00823 [Myxococcaceae bacterium]